MYVCVGREPDAVGSRRSRSACVVMVQLETSTMSTPSVAARPPARSRRARRRPRSSPVRLAAALCGRQRAVGCPIGPDLDAAHVVPPRCSTRPSRRAGGSSARTRRRRSPSPVLADSTAGAGAGRPRASISAVQRWDSAGRRRSRTGPPPVPLVPPVPPVGGQVIASIMTIVARCGRAGGRDVDRRAARVTGPHWCPSPAPSTLTGSRDARRDVEPDRDGRGRDGRGELKRLVVVPGSDHQRGRPVVVAVRRR